MPEAVLICGGRERARVKAGGAVSLRELAARLHPGSGDFLAPTIAVMGGEAVLRENDGWARPVDPSAVVLFIELPMGGGGGSNPLTAILGVVAAVVLAWNPGGWIAGAGLLGFAEGSIAYGLTMGLVNGALIAGTTMLVGALGGFSSMPSGLSGAYGAAAASPTYNINSSGNQARLYQPEPEGFGRMQIVPDYVVTPWVQYIENEQFGYFVYGLGRGSYSVESMSFGETVFWRSSGGVDSAYDNVEVQFVEPGEKVTLFPDNVVTSDEVSGQELYGPNEDEYKGAVGPYTTNPPGTATTQIQLDYVLPQGIGRYDDNANLQSTSLEVQADYRLIDDYGNPLSEWASLTRQTFSGATLTPQRRTALCDVAAGRYEVRQVRTTDSANNGRTMDTVQWTAMRAMLPGSLSYDVSTVAVKIRATNTLSNNASSKFSLIATRRLPLYDRAAGTWSAPVPTRSWAAAVSAVCKAEWGGGLEDRQIALDALWAIDERLQARGWQYDAYIDGAYNVWQLIAEMCQPMLCIPRLEGPILSFVEDRADRPVRYMLTPRNIRRGSFKVTFTTWGSNTPDDVVMSYLDSAYGFQQRDVVATLPESESREETTLEMLGITTREHAYRTAVGYAARNRWRRIGVECQVEGLGRLLNRGDVVTVAHPRLRDTASGKVAAWDENALALTLRKDAGDVPESGELYLALSLADGSVWGPCRVEERSAADGLVRVVLDAEDYAFLLLGEKDGPWSRLRDGSGSLPGMWTLQTGREFRRRMLVQSVTPSDLWTYTVTLVNDDERVYGYDDLPVPPWEERGQLPTVDSLDVPAHLTVSIGGTPEAPALKASWLPVTGAEGYEAEYASNGAAWKRAGRFNINQAEIGVPAGSVQLRVAAVRGDMQSGWAYWLGDTRVIPPAAPEPSVSWRGADLLVEWPEVPGADSYGVSIAADSGVVDSVSGLVAAGYELTAEAAAKLGGPWRSLSVEAWGVNDAGPGPVAAAQASAPAPAQVTGAEVSATADSITLSAVTGPPPVGEGVTGYVLLQGAAPDFGVSAVTGMRIITALPFTLSGLTPGTTFYFRLAAKDAWFDAVPTSYAALNFSGVLPVTTAGAETAEGGGDA